MLVQLPQPPLASEQFWTVLNCFFSKKDLKMLKRFETSKKGGPREPREPTLQLRFIAGSIHCLYLGAGRQDSGTRPYKTGYEIHIRDIPRLRAAALQPQAVSEFSSLEESLPKHLACEGTPYMHWCAFQSCIMSLSDSKLPVPQMANEHPMNIQWFFDVLSDKDFRGRGAKTLAAIGRKLSPRPSNSHTGLNKISLH